MTNRKHVIVLGAGPGGLACAYELAQEGISSTVLERNDYVGGLCRTVDHNGYRFDLGGHRWFTKNQDLHNWFLRLMDNELVEVDRISRIFHDNRFFQYPLSVLDVVRHTRWLDVARILAGFGVSAVRSTLVKRPAGNMEEAFVAQFGRPLYEMFFRIYSEKVWGRPCSELSADWVAQRSAGLSVKDLIKDALIGSNNKHESLTDRFVYPRKGYVRVPERLAEEAQAHGSDIRMRTSVSRVCCHGPGSFEVFYDQSGERRSVRGSDVVSTIPLGYLASIVEPAVNPEALECARALEFRDLVTVTIMLDVPRVTRDSWVYVQDQDILFGRIHEPANWSRALVPDDRHTSLVMECFCSRGDDIWGMNDEDIVQRCVADLADKLSFIERRNVTDAVVVRTPNAYPVYDLDYARKLAVINEALDEYEGLWTVGRSGTFRYNNADHSIEMGLLCARRVAGSNIDHGTVNTEQEYHEIRGYKSERRSAFMLSSGSGT